MSQQRVAVVGVGTMGSGMARTLLREGFAVHVWNRTPDRLATLAEAGAVTAESVRDAVLEADCVITMVFDESALAAVTDEIVANLRPDAVWLQCSTVGQAAMAKLADRIGDSVRLVDAPVLGTKQPAEQGKLVVLASGPADAVASAQPVIDAIGSRLVLAGEKVGQASALKLVCNSWLTTLTAGAAQALALAEEMSLDPHLFLEAIKGGTQDSPYLQRKGAQMIAGDYATGFAVGAAHKDAELARAAAAERRVPTELFDALATVLARAAATGDPGQDIAAVRRAFATPPEGAEQGR